MVQILFTPAVRRYKHAARRHLARGVTLIELLIAMVISLVVIGAASSLYLISNQSFTTVDSSSQLQDSARFATYILRRMVQQSGYEDFSDYAADAGRAKSNMAWAGQPICVQSDLCGFNNSIVPVANIVAGTAGSNGTLPGPFYSDTLVVQFQGQSLTDPATKQPSATADGSIIDCSGTPVAGNTTVPPTRAMSALYVEINSVTDEPELYCSSRIFTTGAGRPRTPLVKGVEVFKVMYEVGNDVEGAPTTNAPDGTPDRFRWVSADQVAGLAITKPANSTTSPAVTAWQSVVAVRFGLVLRGDAGTASPPAAAVTYYPLGQDLANAADPATTYVAPIDSRLRRVVTFTVHLRNRNNAFFIN